MVGDDNHRLGKKAHAFRFHHRGDAGQGLARPDNMVEQTCAFLNGSPDRVLLMRTQLDGFGRAHQFKVGAVIGRRDIRIELFVVELGQHVPTFVIRPYPIKERLFELIGLLHGGCGQFLINDHDVIATFVFLPAWLLHLDGLVREQAFDNLSGGIFGYAPYAGGERGIPYVD